MKKSGKINRIVAGMMLSSLLLVTAGSESAYAATNVSGKIGNLVCSGSVSYSSTPAGVVNGVNAVTSFGAGGTIKATSTVCYMFNGIKYKKTASNTSSAGGVLATAKTGDVGNVYGGIGVHYVKYGAYTWNDTSKIGTTW